MWVVAVAVLGVVVLLTMYLSLRHRGLLVIRRYLIMVRMWVLVTSVSNWVERYNNHGLEALRARPRGRPPRRDLRLLRPDEVRSFLFSHSPDQVGMPGLLWTWQGVGILLASRLGHEVSRWTVSRYVADWGLRVPRPLESIETIAPEVSRRWFTTEYRTTKARARKVRATILFVERTQVTGGAPPSGRGSFELLWLVGGRGEWAFLAHPGSFGEREIEDAFERALQQWGTGLVFVAPAVPPYRRDRLLRWLERTRECAALELIHV